MNCKKIKFLLSGICLSGLFSLCVLQNVSAAKSEKTSVCVRDINVAVSRVSDSDVISDCDKVSSVFGSVFDTSLEYAVMILDIKNNAVLSNIGPAVTSLPVLKSVDEDVSDSVSEPCVSDIPVFLETQPVYSELVSEPIVETETKVEVNEKEEPVVTEVPILNAPGPLVNDIPFNSAFNSLSLTDDEVSAVARVCYREWNATVDGAAQVAIVIKNRYYHVADHPSDFLKKRYTGQTYTVIDILNGGFCGLSGTSSNVPDWVYTMVRDVFSGTNYYGYENLVDGCYAYRSDAGTFSGMHIVYTYSIKSYGRTWYHNFFDYN